MRRLEGTRAPGPRQANSGRSESMTFRRALLALVFLLPAQAARAWWDEGHMQIAYVAYQHLDPAVRDKASSPDHRHRFLCHREISDF